MAVPATVVAATLVLGVAAMAVAVQRQLFEATAFLPHLFFEVDFEKRFTDAMHLD